jgi:hypothetical protein
MPSDHRELMLEYVTRSLLPSILWRRPSSFHRMPLSIIEPSPFFECRIIDQTKVCSKKPPQCHAPFFGAAVARPAQHVESEP